MLNKDEYNHNDFYNIYKEIYNEELDFKEVENDIEYIMDTYLKNKLKYCYNIESIVETILTKFYTRRISSSDKQRIKNKVIMHNNRVIEHLKIILFYANEQGRKKFTEQELFVMFTACIFHDVGKIYSEDDFHPIYSYLITKYVLKMNEGISEYEMDLILEIVLMHGNKRNFQNKISEYTAYVRDADLFDENCGFSLFTLLNDMVMICKRNKKFIQYDEYDEKYLKKINLNKPDFHMSDHLSLLKTEYDHKNKIKSKISIPWNSELYEIELRRALNDYENIKFGYKMNLESIYNKITKYNGSYKIDIN